MFLNEKLFGFNEILRLITLFIRPPVISGSHTLQHPNRNKHDMMMAANYQQQAAQQQQQQQAAQQQQQHHNQNMRQFGTHTLGRLPSHLSPQHHAAGNKHGKLQ